MYRENDLLLEDPNTIIFPLKEMNFQRYHYYQPLLKKILGIKTELGNRILKIMQEHFGPGGDKIFNNQLKNLGLTIESLSSKDLPKIADELYTVTTPIFGAKRAKTLQEDINNLEALKQ